MAHSRNPSSNPRTPLTTSFSSNRRSSSFNDSPNSPTNPTHHRRPSSSRSRRSSSGYSPHLTRPGSGYFGGTVEGVDEDGGAGTLADELGGWDENDEDEYDDEEEEEDEYDDQVEEEEHQHKGRQRDSGIDIASPLINGKKKKASGLGIEEEEESEDRETDEEKNDVDAEELRLVAANLEARLAAVESLAKRGTGEDGEDGDVIARATEQLKDLGLQSGIETGVTRLVTAHTAISTHLANQTRQIQHITTTLLSPLNTHPISPELAEEVLPSITSTLAFLPSLAPDPTPAEELHALSLKTNSLLHALATVADSVNIVNGTTAVTASRRMRAVREVLTEIRTEGARRDDGVRYIEQGCWNQRLVNRECASVCGEVLSGFEETCGKWREWLVRRSEAAVIA